VVNINKHTKTKPKPKLTRSFTNCCHCVLITVHNTTHNSSDYPPDFQTIIKAKEKVKAVEELALSQ